MGKPIDKILTFHPEELIAEFDLSGLTFSDTAQVNRIYDEFEAQIAATGRQKWFFLVNLNNTTIEPGAWMAYARRGRLLNEAHSLGSVRFDAGEATHREIEARAKSEAFDANLFETREAALARIAELRKGYRQPAPVKPRPHSRWGEEEFARRVTLHEDLRVMEADFSHFTFETLGDVHDFYDYLDHIMRVTGRKWYFLVNYQDTHIDASVWGAFANRGKKLNHDFSLGTVRFDASPETAEEIRRRAGTEMFDPNLTATREAALARIEAKKRAKRAPAGA